MHKLPILYLSKYINQTKATYYECLYNMRLNNKYIKDYLLYMIKGVEEMSQFTIEFIENFKNSMDKASLLMKDKCPKIYSMELINYLFYDFYTKNEYLRNNLKITRNTASKYLHELVETGFLVEEKVGKEKIYKNTFLYELVSKW